MKKIFTTLIFAGLCNLIFAQAGTLDPSFGNNGIVRTDLGNPYSWDNGCAAILMHPDGSFYLVITMRRQIFISHRLANGELDLSYGENGYSIPIYMEGGAALMQPDGKIVIGGSRPFGNDFLLARMNPNGYLDNSFSSDGIVETDFFDRRDVVTSLDLQPDGKIVAVGDTYHQYDYEDRFAIARYNSDGSLDNSFSEDGIQMTTVDQSGVGLSVDIQPDGKIVAAGYSRLGFVYNMAIVRYLPNGTLDNSFSGDGMHTITQGWSSSAGAVAVQADGKIVAAGSTLNNFNVAGFLLVRLNTDGTPDNTFSGDGIQINHFPINDAYVHDMTLQPDGKILIAGSTYLPGYSEFSIARYNANGTLDNSFSGDGIDAPNVSVEQPTGSANSVALMPDGRIMIAGTYIYSMAFAAVRYHANGTLDNSLDGDGILKDQKRGGNTYYRGTAVQSDGKLVVVGITDMWTAEPHFAITRYNTNGTLDAGFSGDGKLVVDLGAASEDALAVAIQPDGKILVAGSVTENNNADFAVFRLNADGTMDNSFSGDGKVLTDIRGYNDGATGIAIRPDGRIVVCGYSNLWASDDDFAVVQYMPDGNLDLSFSGDGKQTTDLGASRDRANAVVVQQDGKILLAGKKGFTAQVDHSIIALVRYNLDGSPDVSFDTDGIVLTDVSAGENEAKSLAIDANGNLVVGGTAGYDMVALRYTINGLPDNSFSGDGRQLITLPPGVWGGWLLIQPDGKLVVGGTEGAGYNNDFVLARLNPDGGFDNSFSDDGILKLDLGGEDDLFSLALHGNRIYAAGASLYGGVLGTVAAFIVGETSCNLTATIPDAYTLNNGVDANTVYTGYTPAADITLTVQISGGTAPYTYAWSNVSTATSVTVMPTVPTTYSVTVTDAAGCSKTVSKLINVIDVRCGNKLDKVMICRVSPGNSSNSGTQCVDANAVAVHLNNGSYLGNCKPALLTGFNAPTISIENNSRLKVYPNPGSSWFFLILTPSKEPVVTIVVWDVVGRVVEKKSMETKQTIILGAGYRPGVYFVELTLGNEKFRVKLVKQ